MADLIDRQTAIEIAIEAADEWDGGTSFSRNGIIERRFKMIPAVHVADISKKDEQPAEIAQNMQNGDLIQREAAIEALARMMPRSYTPDGSHPADEEIFRAQEVFVDCIEALEILPSVQPEPLTDKEQRIFLAAMRREEKVCKQVDGLVRTCHEIIRKVKGTLWT